MKNTLAKILQILLYFIMFAGMVGVFYACYTLAPNGDVGQMVLLFILLAVFFLLSLVFIPVLHEVGHLVLGKLCGMKLISVRLFAWEIIREGERLTCELVNPFTASTAGECRMYPTDREGMQKKYLCFALGGLLFQLAYLTLALAVVFICNNAYLWATLGITLPYCAYLLLVNLLPFSSDYDGSIVYGLCTKDPSQTVAVNILTIEGCLAEGYTPSEMDQGLYFDLPQLPEDDPSFSLLQYYRYVYYLDKGELNDAVKSLTRLESCLEYLPDEYWLPISLELTFVYAFLIQDKERAEHYHASIEHFIEDAVTAETLRSEIAYAFLSNNRARMDELLPVLKEYAQNQPLQGIKKFEEKLYVMLQNA